jgi:hypothetical protein
VWWPPACWPGSRWRCPGHGLQVLTSGPSPGPSGSGRALGVCGRLSWVRRPRVGLVLAFVLYARRRWASAFESTTASDGPGATHAVQVSSPTARRSRPWGCHAPPGVGVRRDGRAGPRARRPADGLFASPGRDRRRPGPGSRGGVWQLVHRRVL